MSTIERTISSGEVIIREGDAGNTFFQLLEGKVGVYNNYGQEDQVQIAILEPGTYFGEMAVIESYPRSSTVVAEEDSRVIEIAAEELYEYITENPSKILDIIVYLCQGKTLCILAVVKQHAGLDHSADKFLIVADLR